MILVSTVSATFVFAKTIHVPADQPTVQAGINAASSGDTVLVVPGTYKENINFNGKAITLKSSSGAKVTTINAGGVAPVVTFSSNETSTSVIEGFTIQDGTGSGIYVSSASPTIKKTTLSRTTQHVPGEPALQSTLVHH